MDTQHPQHDVACAQQALTLGPTEADALLLPHAHRCVVLMPSFGKCTYRTDNQTAVTNWYAQRNIAVVLGTDTRSRAGYFSRARAINSAARETHETHPERDIYFIADNDLIPSIPHIVHAIQALDRHPAVAPHHYTLHTSIRGRDQLLKGRTTFMYHPHPSGSKSYVVMERASFEANNGMDEKFEGWGPEDMAFIESIEKQLGPVLRLDGRRLHLWHPVDTSKRDRKQVLANRTRYKQYQHSNQHEAKLLAREYGSLYG